VAGDIQTYTDIEEIEGKLAGMAWNIAAVVRADASKLPLSGGGSGGVKQRG
jgi:hypothetical protein